MAIDIEIVDLQSETVRITNFRSGAVIWNEVNAKAHLEYLKDQNHQEIIAGLEAVVKLINEQKAKPKKSWLNFLKFWK